MKVRDLIIGMLAWAIIGALLASPARASSWLDASPTFGQRQEVPAGQQLPETLASAGNIDCQSTGFTVQPQIAPLQNEIVQTACGVRTAYGTTASGGFVHMFGVAARLYNNGGGAVRIYSIPGQRGAVVLDETANGTRLQYYEHGAYSSRREVNWQTGEWKFYLAPAGKWTLRDASGKMLYVRSESIAFSSNGRWMVVDSEHLASLLVNLETGEVLPFAKPYVYHVGLSVTPHLAVSDDGKTVVRTSDGTDVQITDITSCDSPPPIIIGPVSCRSTNIETIVRQKVGGYYRVYQPRFIHDRLLKLYISYNQSPTSRALTTLRVVPAGDPLVNEDYLALGDSFSSGEGAYDYYAETDTPQNRCHLSRKSYPYLIGQQLLLAAFHSVACSGARIHDISSYAQKPNIPTNSTLGPMLPGYQKQAQYIADRNPSVVTIGIGGNDIGFGDKQKRCLAPGTCFNSYEDRLELVREMNRQLPRLTDVYAQAKRDAGPGALIYAVGYPQVVTSQGNCAYLVPLDGAERLLINQIIDYFNQIIAIAAMKAGVQYVDVSQAFAGHRLCETSILGSAVNGLMAGDDIPWGLGPFGNESFHPNQLGHRLYRQAILTQTSNFTRNMPTPNSSLAAPEERPDLPLLQAPKSNRPVREIIYDPELSPSTIAAGATFQIKAAEDYYLEPNSPFTVEIHSNPKVLGEFTTDSSGRATATIDLPEDTAPGYHTFHLLARTIVGRAVDIYKTIYVPEEQPICYAYGNRNCSMKEENNTDTPGAPPIANEPAPTQPAKPTVATAATPKASEDDVLAAATSKSLHAEEKKPLPPEVKKRGKFKRAWHAWWDNKTARWITIAAVGLLILGVAVYPRTRYYLLNTAGVRSSASVTVIDTETRQPLKNVTVQLHNAQGTTNDDGYVKLEDVRLGSTTLVVSRRAFAPQEKSVTIGWGSNPLDEVLLEPKGLQYSFIVKDFLSGKPIEKAEAISGDASAFSDKDGKVSLTLDTTSDQPVDISLKADGYRTEKITETAESTNDKPVAMVPAQQQAFISKRSGKYDLYKIYADGTGETLVLSGTGTEREDITLVPQSAGNNVALVSTRDNQRASDGTLLSTLNIINLDTNKVTKLDSGDRVQVVGWIDNTLIYIVVSEQAPANGAKKQRLVSYNLDNSQKLDISTADYFNAAAIAGDKVYYAPASDFAAAAGGTGNNTTAVGLYMADASGANTKRVFDQEVWSIVRTSYDALNFSTGKDWYEYKLAGGQPSRLGGAPADQKTRIYTNNGANTQSLWIDQRDGKGVLLSYDLATKQDTVLTGQSGLAYPVRWLNDTTAVYRVHSNDETADYVVSLNGGVPKKIVNVTNTTGVDKWYYY